MRVRLSVIAAALLVVTTAAPVPAEPIGAHFEVTPFGGFTVFDSAIRSNGFTLRDAGAVGGRLGWFPNTLWGLELAGDVTPSGEDLMVGGADVNYIHASGNLAFTPWARRSGGPFVSAGFGGAQVRAPGNHLNQGNLELAAGLRFWLTDQVGLRFEARDQHWIPNNQALTSTDVVTIGAGITFALGARPRDTDGDGVPDKLDQCPNTPKGAKVDAKGCPIDSDGDGVYDGLDQCPGTPKGCKVDAKGCPSDADGDGVCDGVDQCPDTPKGATVDARGCPKDSDGDGVLDGLDKCPNTPKGCTVDKDGCPKDSDGDGVCDGLDRCPDTSPGLKVDKDGCPIEVVERETELLDTGMIRLQNVNFETAKANVLPESYPTLDIVGQVLTQWPELKIEVGGHTDSRGSEKLNQKLSEARADSVLAYLIAKFPKLKAEQFTARGYGKSRPIVPNTNVLNMAKNRRVEFVVQNKDVLRKESERRRLLRQGESAPPDTTKKMAPPDTTKKMAPPDTTRKAAPPDTTKKAAPAPAPAPAPAKPPAPAAPDTTKKK
ncbi:MAG: OmpA family protein [Candidatus Eisenbacteria bacterium]|uniref:OmpA family protein n=1 Tax=Eiseniibacteriota bacterium TaxID=2212470 RepID=A0A9D6QJ28_UNCEI|nr:OmpA family protein [Candidatus Eisenbacteria bacterium]